VAPLRRLTTLPPDIQSTIYRKAGRHTRQVSPQWKEIYGPLDCGVSLDSITTKEDIDSLLSHDPHRFHHVTTLHMTIHAPDKYHHYPFPEGVISSLPHAFPKLQSLEVSHSLFTFVPVGEILSLTALRSCLTALVLPGVEPILPATDIICQLTSLRSLAFDWDRSCTGYCYDPIVNQADSVEAMRQLSRLPHLQRLLRYPGTDRMDGIDCSGFICPAAAILPVLGGMNLTDLGVNMALVGWDRGAVNVLRTALPQLTALALSFHLGKDGRCGRRYADDSAWTHGVIRALAQRTGLRSLTLQLGAPTEDYQGLASLSALQLAELRVAWCWHGAEEYVPLLLEAMAVQGTLTSLAIRETRSFHHVAPLSEGALRSLAALAPALQRLAVSAVAGDAAAFFDVVGSMSRLTALELQGSRMDRETMDPRRLLGSCAGWAACRSWQSPPAGPGSRRQPSRPCPR
jgi:hypothetical protein